MIPHFEVLEHNSPRPDAQKIIFCDGTGGAIFQPETDLELSHWRPNHTPAEFRAGTSTEICFRFLDNPRSGEWTIAVNNHVDVDGLLSIYTLVQCDHAQAHRQTIIQAAEMGDFWGWGEQAAQRLFQGITWLMNSGNSGREVYAEAFRRIPGLIDGSDPQSTEIDDSLVPLRDGVALVEQGQIERREIDARFVHYIVPLSVAGADDARASYVPEFNEAISTKAVLLPQVRAKWDAEKVCLVSVERVAGWFHDLFFPGYLWADTEAKWLVPGMTYHDGMSSYDLIHAPLSAAFEKLQQLEAAEGNWNLGKGDLQKQFPLVGRFLNRQGQVAISRQRPDQVVDMLQGVFA